MFALQVCLPGLDALNDIRVKLFELDSVKDLKGFKVKVLVYTYVFDEVTVVVMCCFTQHRKVL